MAEFREGLEQFCGRCDENKVQCLFQIYDEDGNEYYLLSTIDNFQAMLYQSLIKETE